MIEIAIAIGVIGFAMVAIIGILPRGMNVQKDNREDTIISQDAPYFMNAIRNGETRTNNNILLNYVETIVVTNVNFTTGATSVTTNDNPFLASGANNNLITDSNVIGILSTPYYDGVRFPGETHIVSAIVRAMSGSASQQNGANSATAFRYQLTVEIDPWNSISVDSTNIGAYTADTPDWISRSNRLMEVPYLTNSLHEIRLRFAWPVFPNGSVGQGRQTYRSVVSSRLQVTNTYWWYFQPQSYTTDIQALNL